MTVIQECKINTIAFTYSAGKTSLKVPLGGASSRIFDLSIEDVETIAEFLNGVVRNYHVRDYRFNEVVRE